MIFAVPHTLFSLMLISYLWSYFCLSTAYLAAGESLIACLCKLCKCSMQMSPGSPSPRFCCCCFGCCVWQKKKFWFYFVFISFTELSIGLAPLYRAGKIAFMKLTCALNLFTCGVYIIVWHIWIYFNIFIVYWIIFDCNFLLSYYWWFIHPLNIQI